MAKRQFSLAHLSMIEVPPVELVAVAATSGYQYTGFRLTPTAAGVDHGILGDSRALAELKRVIDDSGVGILDVEVIRMKEPAQLVDPRPLLEAAGTLGARYVITTIEDQNSDRRVECLGDLAGLAASYGIGIAIEFMVFSSAPNLIDAADLISRVQAPNVVLLADVLHLERSGGRPSDIGLYPPNLFPYAQICGARGAGPAPDVMAAREEAVNARLMPSEGDLQVAGFIAALPGDAILSVECPIAGQGNPIDPTGLAREMLRSANVIDMERT